MKIADQIIDKAERMDAAGKIDWKKVKQFKREPGFRLRNATEKYHFVILGNGDVNSFKAQPLVVLPLNDYLAQLKSVK